jgi:hypothetical protein
MGASNMRGEINGLKSLILKENKCAFYVHCFAHQLQLALVAVANKLDDIAWFFIVLNNLTSAVGASCKRKDMLRESQNSLVTEAVESGEISTGRGLNQETTLTRAGDTRWGSHYGTLLRLTSLFPSVCDVLNMIVEDSTDSKQRVEARLLLDSLQSFEFIFKLLLMRNVLGITNDLCQALQRKDQDIVNAMSLVKLSKQRLQNMRDDGWPSLLSEVALFCEKHDIDIVNMDDAFVLRGKPKRKLEKVSNLHHFQVEVFYQVIDRQLQELMGLDNQLENYILDVRSCEQFSNLDGIGDLSRILVETRKHIAYPMVYLLLKLALLLPVATATVERCFSSMNYVKNQLRNRMGDDFLNALLVTYIESDIFESVENEKILEHFQNMKSRREQL